MPGRRLREMIQLVDPTVCCGRQIPATASRVGGAGAASETESARHDAELPPLDGVAFQLRCDLHSLRIFCRRFCGRTAAAAAAAGGEVADSAGRGPGRARRRGARGTNIVLNVQMQYRRTENEALNVFPNLGGTTTNTSIAVPISLNVSRGRSIQNFTVNLTHATVQSANNFAGTNNAASDAGIKFPGAVATDPLNWGVPNLSFSGFTGVRSNAASLRTDDRLTTSYFWLHPTTKHQLRLGGDFRLDTSSAETRTRGTFIYGSSGGL